VAFSTKSRSDGKVSDDSTVGQRGGRHYRKPEPDDAAIDGRDRFTTMLAGAVGLTWRASHRGFVLAATLQIIGALSSTLVVLVGKYALDAILKTQSDGASTRTLITPVILLALVTAAGSAAGILQQQQQRLLGEQVSSAAWEQVLDVTGRVRLESYESPTFFDQLQRVKNNAVAQPITVTTSIFNLIGGVASVIGLLAVLASIEPLLIPVLLIGGVPAVLLSRRVSNLEFQFLVRATPVYRARQYLRQTLTGRDEAKEVRAFGAEPALRARHDRRRVEYTDVLRAHIRTRQIYAAIGIVLTSVSLGVALGAVVWLLTSGRIELASAAAAILSVRFLSTSLDQLFRSVGGLFESSVYLADLAAFTRLSVDGDGPGTGVAPTFRSAISVRHISYTYPGTEAVALEDVSLDIHANQVVALVGENGSGKTTLAKLVAGLYTPASGSVRTSSGIS
jgi:ATP-binding cassette subfamily B protein